MFNKIIKILIITMLLAGAVTPVSASIVDDTINWISGNLNQLTSYGSDLTIQSITADKPITNSANLATTNFLVSAVVNGGGQTIVDNVASSDFERECAKSGSNCAGIRTSYPLAISMSNFREQLIYPINNQAKFYQLSPAWYSAEWIQPIPLGQEFIPAAAWDFCKSGSTASYCFLAPIGRDSLFRWHYKALEVWNEEIGNYGIIGNPDVTWSGSVNVNVNGLTQTKTIGNSASLGHGSSDSTINNIASGVDFNSASGTYIGNIKWVGSLMTGTATPYQGSYKAIYSRYSPAWKVSPMIYWTEYITSYNSLTTMFNGWKTAEMFICGDASCSAITYYTTPHAQKVSTLMAQNSAITYTSGTSESLSQSTSGTVTNGFVTETTSRRIANPVLNMRIAAINLGVLIPVCTPVIASISSPVFASGSQGSISAVVNNNCDYASSFYATVTEPTGTFTIPNSAPINIGAKSSGTIQMVINHGAGALATSTTATMTVYDYNDASKYVQKTFTIGMTVPSVCTPGKWDVDSGSNTASRCKADGTGYDIVITCPTGVLEYNSATNMYSCNTGTDPGTQVLSIKVFTPLDVIASSAPILISTNGGSYVLQAETGTLNRNVVYGTYKVSTNNNSNPEWFAPEPKTVTISKTSGPQSVSLTFVTETVKPWDIALTTLMYLSFIVIVLFLAWRAGILASISGNPVLIALIILIIGTVVMFYIIIQAVTGLQQAIMSSPFGAIYNAVNWIFHLGG